MGVSVEGFCRHLVNGTIAAALFIVFAYVLSLSGGLQQHIVYCL